MLCSVVAEAGLENREFSQGAIDVLRTDLVISSLLNRPDGQEVVAEIQERVEAAHIESIPRFGEFTADRGLNPVAPARIVDSPPHPQTGVARPRLIKFPPLMRALRAPV